MAQSRRTPPAGGSRKSGGIWSGILIGLLTGLAGAAAVAVWVGRNNPFTESPTATASPAAKSGATSGASTPNTPIVDPASRATGVASNTHYDFYHILPGSDASGAHPEPAAPAANAPAPAQTWLQAGAFPDPQQADDLKARLALMGYEASIQTVDLADKGTWHRVRLGPYTSAEAGKVQAALAQNHIDTSSVKAAAGDAAGDTPHTP